MELTEHVQYIIHSAKTIVYARDYQSVTPDHIMLALFLDENDLPKIMFSKVGLDNPRLIRDYNNSIPRQTGGASPQKRQDPPLSQSAINLLEFAEKEALSFGEKVVSIEHILLALFKNPTGNMEYIFKQYSVKPRELYFNLKDIVENMTTVEIKNGEIVSEKTNKKSPIIAIIIVVILLALVGVVYVTLQNTPKSVVNGMFKALKDGNYEKVNEYINYQEVISSSDILDSESLDEETMNLLFNKLDWKIIETTQEGNNASVTVEVTNKNFKTIIGNYMQNALRVAFSGQELSDAEMENYLIEELKKEDMETATITQTINLTKQDGKWVINTTDTSLVEILLPGLNEAINSLS